MSLWKGRATHPLKSRLSTGQETWAGGVEEGTTSDPPPTLPLRPAACPSGLEKG